MNPMNQGAKLAGVDARYRVMLILWFAILMSVGIFFLIAQVVERPPAEGSRQTFLLMIAAVAGLNILFSFVIKHRLFAQAVTRQRPDLVQNAMIVAVALCETCALFGLMAYFTTGTPYYYIFFIVSVVGILLHFPRRDQLLAASYKSQDFKEIS
jgi:hypothetical protein